MNLENHFEKASTYEEYESLLGENLKLHQQHYKKSEITEKEASEIRKIAETNGNFSIKVLLRDQNLELMDQFLTRGRRAIPILIFLSEDFSFICKWGPRPLVTQEIYEKHRQQIKENKIEKKEVIKKIRNFYAKDRGKAILTELLSNFKKYGLS